MLPSLLLGSMNSDYDAASTMAWLSQGALPSLDMMSWQQVYGHGPGSM